MTETSEVPSMKSIKILVENIVEQFTEILVSHRALLRLLEKNRTIDLTEHDSFLRTFRAERYHRISEEVEACILAQPEEQNPESPSSG